jgi:hypothetical protein
MRSRILRVLGIIRRSFVFPQPHTDAVAALGANKLNASVFKGSAQAGAVSVNTTRFKERRLLKDSVR